MGINCDLTKTPNSGTICTNGVEKTGKPESQKAGKLEDRKAGKPEGRKARRPESQKAGRLEAIGSEANRSE